MNFIESCRAGGFCVLTADRYFIVDQFLQFWPKTFAHILTCILVLCVVYGNIYYQK